MSSEQPILAELVSTLGFVVFALHSQSCCFEPFTFPFLWPGKSKSESQGQGVPQHSFPCFLLNSENLINMELVELSSEHLDKDSGLRESEREWERECIHL